LYCEGLSTPSTQASPTNTSDDNIRQSQLESVSTGFQVIWPGGTLQVTAKSSEEKISWVEDLFRTICDCVRENSDFLTLGWRHQCMIGSLHSAVISRDEGKVIELIAKCDSGLLDIDIVDSLDEDGYTPLHYACILRLKNVTCVLHDAGADVTIEDSNG
jgi:hypothetical protein